MADRAELLDALNWESRRASVFFGLLNRTAAGRLGLNVTDVEVLGVLAVLGSATPTRLAELLGVGTGTVTLIIDRLERDGFVRRIRDEKDRRRVTIEVIPERARESAALYTPLRQVAAEILDDYSDRDLALIAGYLARSNDILRDAGAALSNPPGRPS